MASYPGYSYTNLTVTDRVPDASPALIRNVEACFAALRPTGDVLAAHVNRRIKPDRYTHKNYGRGRAKIHFQGLQRTRDGIHAFVSGGDSREPAAHLFTLQMASRSVPGGWCSNLLHGGEAPAGDGVISVTALSRKHWHAGGMGLLGEVLVMPLEADNEPSLTMFFDVSAPAEPKHLPALDIRGVSRVAGAAALTRLPNGYFLCAVYRDEKMDPSGFIDFYLSVSTDLAHGFRPAALTWWYRDAINVARPSAAYQNVALLLDGSGPDDPQSRLYLLATENTARGAPVEEGDNLADLFLVDFGSTLTDPTPSLTSVALTRVATMGVTASFGWGNLDAMGGVHVDACGRLNLYAGAHWRSNELIRFTEFRCDVGDDAGPIDGEGHAWIDLFEHPRFSGRRLTILGRQDAELADYSRLVVQGGRLDDRISSVRFQLPVGTTYRLFDRPNFDDGGAIADLIGTGRVESVPDLHVTFPNIADRISSSRYI